MSELRVFSFHASLAALLLASSGCGSSARSAEGGDCDSPLTCPEGESQDGANGDDEGDGNASGVGTEGGADGSGSGESGALADDANLGADPQRFTSGPHFAGSGSSFRPLTAGCGPQTATQCTGSCEQGEGSTPTEVIRPPATLCFAGEGDQTPEDPSVVIEQVIERTDAGAYVHVRVTFDPSFTDNTYGAGSVGWSPNRGHRFSDLTKSDHTELNLTNGSGEVALHFKLDLVTETSDAACGFGTLGVAGGDGSMIAGDPAHVLAVATSLDRNLNGCGYCESPACGPSGDCSVDSPTTDETFAPSSETPFWDYRQVYEAWIDLAAFGESGFGQAFVTYTHSSPAKGSTDTISVEPSPCPPDWDEPYCPPDVLLEGGNCFGTPPGGDTPEGEPECPPNQQAYVLTEGASICTPIPFANNPGMDPCPEGYALDLASEGQYCVPTN